jgi:hypothetical protein
MVSVQPWWGGRLRTVNVGSSCEQKSMRVGHGGGREGGSRRGHGARAAPFPTPLELPPSPPVRRRECAECVDRKNGTERKRDARARRMRMCRGGGELRAGLATTGLPIYFAGQNNLLCGMVVALGGFVLALFPTREGEILDGDGVARATKITQPSGSERARTDGATGRRRR